MTGVHIANQNGNVMSYIKDYHGNVVAKANESGSMIDEIGNRRDYDAFGNQWKGTTSDPFGYCGEYYDSESGLIYLRNRYYDSETGRFITEDPAKDGTNWYVYCGNEPVMMVDSSGLSDVPKWLDWNGDGFLDTEKDRMRFDANSNNIADWIEEGYSTAQEWNDRKTSNSITGFTHINQAGENCTIACITMVVNSLTDTKVTQKAVGTFASTLLNKDSWDDIGLDINEVEEVINEGGYLNNSGYMIDTRVTMQKQDKEIKFDFSPSFVKSNIDAGIPIIITFKAHARVITGYRMNGRDCVLELDDPDGGGIFDKDYDETINTILTNCNEVDLISFKRIR